MKILIAEDDPVCRYLLTSSLTRWGHEVVSTRNGLEAWQRLQEEDAPRLAILDWMMPGLEGPEVCRRARGNPKTAPTYIILLTALSRKEQLVAGIAAGADDYLSKPFCHDELRVRLNSAARIIDLQAGLARQVLDLEAAVAERQQAEATLRNLTLTDDLTGLYNHRGFFTLAEHLLKAARRAQQNSLLVYADLDGLKDINDRFGHSAGSQALVKAADILRQTFRESDIIARLGGDEFAVLSPNVPPAEVDEIMGRLELNLQFESTGADSAYEVSLSFGAVPLMHDNWSSLQELVAEADARMYQQKRHRKLSKLPGPGPKSLLVSPQRIQQR